MPVKILLAGGGHAILPFISRAAQLPSDTYHISLISENPYLYYSGMIPEFLGGVYTEDDIRINLEHLCRINGIHFIKSRVIDVDQNQRRLTTDENKDYDYDILAFDLGSNTPHPDYLSDDRDFITVKPLHHLGLLHRRLTDKPKRLVVVGGGAAGVEIGLNISALQQPVIQTGQFRMSIYESQSRLLPEFPENVSNYAVEILTKRGVNVYAGEKVHLERQGEMRTVHPDILSADIILWATGTHGSPVFSRAHLPVDSRGFLKVDSRLKVPDDSRIYAAGDCVNIDAYPSLAKIGVHAIREAPVLAANLEAAARNLAEGKPVDVSSLKKFRPYPVTPVILSTGDREAIWTTQNFGFHSRGALRLKHFLDRRWITRYKTGSPWKTLADMLQNDNALKNG